MYNKMSYFQIVVLWFELNRATLLLVLCLSNLACGVGPSSVQLFGVDLVLFESTLCVAATRCGRRPGVDRACRIGSVRSNPGQREVEC